jgi:hypothetical protein
VEVVYSPSDRRLTRRRTEHDVVWVRLPDGRVRPYAIHLRRFKDGRYGMQVRPIDAYSREVAEYVKQEIKNCWAARLRGEAFQYFVKMYGIHPLAWCVKRIMAGRRFKQQNRMTDAVLQALIARYGAVFPSSPASSLSAPRSGKAFK